MTHSGNLRSRIIEKLGLDSHLHFCKFDTSCFYLRGVKLTKVTVETMNRRKIYSVSMTDGTKGWKGLTSRDCLNIRITQQDLAQFLEVFWVGEAMLERSDR